jgi:two-component system chemotaxis response regulator CheB
MRAFQSTGGVVVYSIEAKKQLLGVSADTLDAHGPVAEQTTLEMARLVMRKLGSDMGLATTAIGFPTIIPSRVLGADAPSNKINILQIGCGRIGREMDMPGILRQNAARAEGADNAELAETGVVLIASREKRFADRVIRGLEAGAFDFVRPPAGEQPASTDEIVPVLMRQLLVKLRHFASKRIFSSLSNNTRPAAPLKPEPIKTAAPFGKIKAVLIGVSTGGPKTLATLLPQLSGAVKLPILVVQHMPPEFTTSLAASLNGRCAHRVVEAKDNTPVESDCIYIAPGGKHLLVQRGADRAVRVALSDEPPEEGCRPSANVLFAAAAKVYGADLVALVLTGMGQDGARGARELKKAGAWVVAQDKASSVVWGMPGAAVASGCVDKILHPDEMAEFIATLAQG